MDRKNAWMTYREKDFTAVEELSSLYRRFLDCGKTERECISYMTMQAEMCGYRRLEEVINSGESIKLGDKISVNHMGKAAAFFIIGKDALEQGMNIIGAHVDSPRLDIKQIPLYDEQGNVYLDTHYYGGVKKYQWLALPLALHGVVVKKDGTKTEICIGEKQDDPVLVISDLLPHLGKERNEQKVKEFIDAEKMDLLIGNRPIKEEKKDAAKGYVLQMLAERYQIREADFVSAELEVVPAGEARECGIDRSMILGYGQDDRSCAFAAFYAMLNLKESIPERTACCLFVDKEETGSRGATGMHSQFFENAIAEILYAATSENLSLLLRRTLQNSKMLSADVSAAYDPMYEKYFEKKNSAYLANGVVFGKYSGSAGKSGGNDANAEFIAELRRIMEENDVVYQTAELGAVDQGGGGTIAYIMAEYGMDVIDCGLPVLCMHAPWEVISKADLYEAIKGYKAFYESRMFLQ